MVSIILFTETIQCQGILILYYELMTNKLGYETKFT